LLTSTPSGAVRRDRGPQADDGDSGRSAYSGVVGGVATG